MPLLEVDNVGLRFGGVVALSGLSLAVEENSIAALIGPNGAGKTTLFNVVSRLYEPQEGRVTFDGKNLLDLPPHKIASSGIARTFQNLALIPGLSVVENVMIGAHSVTKGGMWAAALVLPSRRQEQRTRSRAMEILDHLSLAHLAKRPCGGLPYGTLKRIELARGIMSEPRLLLLDEPASGLTHGEVDELGEVIAGLRTTYNLTVLLVEHHMGLVMGISDHIVVMELGAKIAEGVPEEIQQNPAVIAAYLGEPAGETTNQTGGEL